MNRNAIAAAVLALGLSTALAAQNPPPTQPPAQPPQPPSASQPAMASQTVTLEGCLAAEKADVKEDFFLTSARVKSPASGASAAEQPTGTSGVGASKYQVKGLEANRLQEFVGQRVEIIGKLDPKARESASPAGDAPALQATSIKKIEGACPAAK